MGYCSSGLVSSRRASVCRTLSKLLVAEKDMNGKLKTKEIMPVRFSLFEGPDEPAFRAS
jgi:hypothetical protein